MAKTDNHVDMVGQKLSIGDTVLFPDGKNVMRIGKVERLMNVMVEITSSVGSGRSLTYKKSKRQTFVVTNNKQVILYLLKK